VQSLFWSPPLGVLTEVRTITSSSSLGSPEMEPSQREAFLNPWRKSKGRAIRG